MYEDFENKIGEGWQKDDYRTVESRKLINQCKGTNRTGKAKTCFPVGGGSPPPPRINMILQRTLRKPQKLEVPLKTSV